MNDEATLIRRSLTLGDEAAFSSLVKLHQGKVRAFLVRLCRNYDLADDLAQDTFVNAFRKLKSYQGTGSFSGWLYRIAYFNFLQHQRRQKRRNEVTEDYSQQDQVLSNRYDSISTEQMDMEKALAQLKPDETAAITLCHSFGYSHQEVADILKMPLGTVKSNISRGKTKLRDIMVSAKTVETSMEQAS